MAKKRGATFNRAIRTAPVLIAKMLAPSVECSELMALTMIQAGTASAIHFDTLLECCDFLMFAATRKNDEPAWKMSEFCRIAMSNIRDRFDKTNRIGATGEELQALRAMVDYSSDFWKRQSGGLYLNALNDLDELRDEQRKRKVA